MSHEHRQHPERYYDDESEAYDDTTLSRNEYVRRVKAATWAEYVRSLREEGAERAE